MGQEISSSSDSKQYDGTEEKDKEYFRVCWRPKKKEDSHDWCLKLVQDL